MTGDTSKMRSTANRLLSNGKKYQESVEELYRQVQALSSNWQGPDYDQFKATCEKHREPLNELGELIIGFGNSLNDAADDLGKTVSNIGNAMK